VEYSEGFKARMVQRMTGPEGISATALCKEVGVPQSTLSRWLKHARTVGGMSTDNNEKKHQKKSPRQWSPEEKLGVVLEAAALSDDELGPFLRSRGIHEAQLQEWRRNALEGLAADGKKAKAKDAAVRKQNKALLRELNRKDKALAEVTALLALKKKLEALMGDEDDGTPTRSGT